MRLIASFGELGFIFLLGVVAAIGAWFLFTDFLSSIFNWFILTLLAIAVILIVIERFHPGT